MTGSKYAVGHRMQYLLSIILLSALLALGGCVSQPLPEYQVGIANQISLSRLTPGVKFQVSHGDDIEAGSAGVRALTTTPPGGSWSAFLAGALQQELVSSGHYVGGSGNAIDVTVVKLMLMDGQAHVSVHFVVREAGVVVYDKVLEVRTKWDSHFIGVIAARDGVANFGAIFQQILKKLFDDPDFIRLG